MPLNFRISRPLARSQSLTVWSQLPESAVLPSGAMATELTLSECPSNFLISRPLARSQSMNSCVSEGFAYVLPDSAVLPSGEKATELIASECPSNILISRPLARSQSLSELFFTQRQAFIASYFSQPPADSAVLPSGAIATE